MRLAPGFDIQPLIEWGARPEQTESAAIADGKRAALARLRNYVGERASTIRYAEDRARGWDTGSGPTRSSN
jgi:hypothetical protein